MSRLLKTTLVVFLFVLCGAALIAAWRARAPAPVARDLYSIVNQQLSAFRAADFDRAYTQASAGIRQKFSRAQFEEMVRRDFASMTEAQHIEFGAVSVDHEIAVAQVFLTSPDDTVREFLYSFTIERGGWKISGVQSLGRQPAQRLPGLRL